MKSGLIKKYILAVLFASCTLVFAETATVISRNFLNKYIVNISLK